MAKDRGAATKQDKPISSKKAKPIKKNTGKTTPVGKNHDLDFEYICLEIEKGKALRRVCPQFMGLEKFYLLLNKSEDKTKRYARACEIRADNIFDDILSIADDNSRDTYTDANGVERTDNDVIQRSRLMVDARKWVLSKMQPKKYGDKLDIDANVKSEIVWIEKKTYGPNDKTD